MNGSSSNSLGARESIVPPVLFVVVAVVSGSTNLVGGGGGGGGGSCCWPGPAGVVEVRSSSDGSSTSLRNCCTRVFEYATASAVAFDSFASAAIDPAILSILAAWSVSCSACWATFCVKWSRSRRSFLISGWNSESLGRCCRLPLALLLPPWRYMAKLLRGCKEAEATKICGRHLSRQKQVTWDFTQHGLYSSVCFVHLCEGLGPFNMGDKAG